MEKETNTLHLLQQHPIFVYVVGAVVIIAIVIGSVTLWDAATTRIERNLNE